MQELEEFVGMQVDVRFDEFKEKVKGVEFSRLLREGSTPSTVAGPAAAPPPTRPHTYKPVEAFLEGRKKPFPWYTIASIGIPAEEYNCITDYINSGGPFSDVTGPVINIKRLMDHKTLRVFMPALNKAIEEGKTHCTRTIIDTLSNLILTHMPKRGCLTKLFQKIKLSTPWGTTASTS